MKQKKGIMIAAICLVAVAAVLLLVWRQFAPATQSGAKDITITVTYADGTEDQFEVTTEAEYLLDAAREVVELDGEEGTYGFTIYGINGEEADFNDGNAYWALYVNGEYGTLGVESQPLTDGDTYAFVYETF